MYIYDWLYVWYNEVCCHLQVLKQMKEFLPSVVVSILSRKCHDHGAELIHDVIQHPLLNKQLSYVLLDALLLELFPEF